MSISTYRIHIVLTNKFLLIIYCYVHILDLHSFPTRRSSDLLAPAPSSAWVRTRAVASRVMPSPVMRSGHCPSASSSGDRKSTRLNSSHVKISYAVFCLKKKKKNTNTVPGNCTTQHANTTCRLSLVQKLSNRLRCIEAKNNHIRY